MTRPLKVFLSHAHADADAVRALYNRLVADGVDAWLDKEKLIPGQDWEREIRKAVREADVVIVCLSKQFNQRGYRQKEVRIALDEADMMPEGEIFIIPARLEECENLESLQKWHWVDLYEKGGYQRLLRSLHFRATKVGAELSPKKNLITGAFRKPIKKYQSTPKIQKMEVVDEDSEKAAKEKEKREASKKAAQEKVRQEKQERRSARRKKWKDVVSRMASVLTRKNIILSISAIVLIFVVAYIIGNQPPQAPTPTSTSTATTSAVLLAMTSDHQTQEAYSPTPKTTNTPRPTSTPTKKTTPTITPYPEGITDSDPSGNKVSMRLVPAGDFIMGDDSTGYLDRDADQTPIHTVHLDSFYMDTYEVTNFLYQVCVEAGDCTAPRYSSSRTRPQYYGNSEFDNFPVIFVNWDQANTYCEWRGVRLPTEAEWEKAARGTDARYYPWGSSGSVEANSNQSTNTNSSIWGNSAFDDTTEVGSYPSGKSPYGLYDMAGNVWEWVNDWYQSDYYTILGKDVSNPQGPEDGDSKVLRGGSWVFGWIDGVNRESGVTSTFDRHHDYPSRFYLDYGFRCAKNAP